MRTKLVICDVDGVLTDGKTYYFDGAEAKAFSVYDGGGVALLRIAKIPLVIMTGERSNSIIDWCNKVGIDDARFGVKDKLLELKKVTEKYNVKNVEVLYIGDFINDIGIMGAVGVSIAPAGVCSEMYGNAHHITARSGGQGVLWEVARDLLIAEGLFEECLDIYTGEPR